METSRIGKLLADEDRCRCGRTSAIRKLGPRYGEVGLRVDYCETCQDYLKTATAEGSEDGLLTDWTSLHLDLLARDRGLRWMAGSLYEL